MNRVERRVRDLINPYSTAFAIWWCHSARYWRLPRAITGNKDRRSPGPATACRSSCERRGIGGFGFPVLSVFPAGAQPWRAGAVSGSVKPIAGDATAGSDLDEAPGSRTMDRREDGPVQPRLRRRVSLTDQW
jgi:hypothetical protein